MSLLFSTPQAPARSIALTADDRARLAAQGLIVLPPPAIEARAYDRRGQWIKDPEEHAVAQAKNESVARLWVQSGRKHGSLFTLCRAHGCAETNVRRAARRLGLI